MSLKEVTILTGFLGAGKTTLLNSIIGKRKETRFAIVENEIGEESIDAELIVKQKDDIIELNNGCLCCSLNDDLYDIISALWNRNSEWDEIIIEATGIADPANIASPFLINPQIMRSFVLRRVICVVDAELIEDQLRDTEEAIKQIAFSDIILLNKIEKVDKAYLDHLRNILESLNPFVQILFATESDMQVDELFVHQRTHTFKSNPKTIKSPRGMISLAAPFPLNTPSTLLAHNHTHIKHQHSSIETILLRFADYVNIENLEHRLYVFLLFQSKDVYRIKGIINSEDHDHKVIIQSVGKRVSLTYGEPWGEEMRENKVVIIGKKIKIPGFEKLLRECLEKSEEVE